MKVPDKWLAQLKSKRIRTSTKERAGRGVLTTSVTPGTALITDLRWICLKLIVYVKSHWSLLISNPQVFFNCKLGHILNRNNWITLFQRAKFFFKKKLSSQALVTLQSTSWYPSKVLGSPGMLRKPCTVLLTRTLAQFALGIFGTLLICFLAPHRKLFANMHTVVLFYPKRWRHLFTLGQGSYRSQ